MPDSQHPWRSGGGSQSRPWRGSHRAAAPVKHDDEGGGVFGALKRIPGDVGRDVYEAAVGTPSGVYHIGKAAKEDVEDVLASLQTGGRGKPRGVKKPFKRSTEIAGAMAKSTIEDFQHPLRHPGYTALDVLGIAAVGAGGVGKVAAAGKAAKAAEGGGRAAAAGKALVTRRQPGVRTFKVGDLEVQHPESKSALTRGGQKAYDVARQKLAERNPHGVAAKLEIRKAKNALAESMRADEALSKADAAALHAAGKKLSKGEQYALRVVAEEAPLNKRIAATSKAMQKAGTAAERRRHQKRLKLLTAAREHIVDADAKPEFLPERTKLRAVYDRMEKVAGSREQLAKDLGVLTDEAIQARKTGAGRAAMGAQWTSPAYDAVVRLDRIEKRRAELLPKRTVTPGEKIVKERPRTKVEAEGRLKQLDAALNPLIDQWAAEIRAAGKEARKGGPRAAEDKYEYWQRNYGKSEGARIAGLPDEDRLAEGFNQKERRGYANRRQDDARDMAEEMLSQVSGREATRKLNVEELLALHKQLVDEGVDVTKLKKALDERDELRGKMRAAEPTPEEAFGMTAAGARPEDFGTVKTVERKPDTITFEEIGPKARRELDELAREEQAAHANVRVNKPRLVGHEYFEASPSSVYIPDVEQHAGRTGRIASLGAQGVIGKPRSPIRQGYRGEMKRQGREPLNTTRAVAEAKLAVARFSRLAALRPKLIRAASSAPRFKDDIAIRLDKLGAHEPLPKDVRAFLDDPGSFAPDQATDLFERVRKQTLLAPENEGEFRKLYEAGKIGWVPKGLLGDLARPAAPLRSSVGKIPVAVADEINNASRVAILFLKPAYAVPNIMGNAALNVIQQGFAAPKNLARASAMQWKLVPFGEKLGKDLLAQIDTVMHEGFSAALRGEGGLPMSQAATFGANIWGKGVDRPFRRASFFHEAARNGRKTAAQIAELFENPELHDELVDIAKRANREIIDYGRLSHREREVVRRVIFFYPWVKGSTYYAGNLLLEHPIKSAALGQIGRMGLEKSREELGPVPSYLEGAFKGPGGGLVNPTAAAILQTPAQAGQIAASVATGRTPEVGEVSEVLTPALAAALNLAAGKNLRTGREYPRTARGVPQVAYDTLVKQLPQFRLYEGLTGRSKARLFPATDRSALMQFLFGGIYPRQYDPSRLRALARREQKELAGR